MKNTRVTDTFSDLFDALHASIVAVERKLATRRFGVAFSGGMDSSCLLTILSEYALQNGGIRLYAIYINHNIRPSDELAIEEAGIVSLCLRHSTPLSVHVLEQGFLESAQRDGASPEEAARNERYRAFESWSNLLNLDGIFLAHHADDQAEQRIMHFFQGSNRDGGMREKRGQYLRPFLAIDRFRLREFASSRAISWHEDSSNTSTDYLRNRIRQQVIPVISGLFPGYKRAMEMQAARFRTDEEFLETLARQFEWRENMENSIQELHGDSAEFDKLHPALRLRVLKNACIRLLGPQSSGKIPSFRFFEPLLEKTLRVPGSIVECILREGENFQILTRSSLIVVRPRIVEPRKFGYLITLSQPGSYPIPGVGTVSLLPGKKGAPSFGLPLVIRSLYMGESVPGRKQNLRDFLKGKGIPASAVDTLPLVEQEGRVRAVLCNRWLGTDICFEDQDSVSFRNETVYLLEIKELEFSL